MNRDLIFRLPHWLIYYTYRTLFPKRFARAQERRRIPALKDENSLQGFDRHKCIFVHIPKAGGVSLAKNLFGDLGGGHIPVYRYRMVYSPTELNEFFKFTIVRNPWDRLVSAYFFLKSGGFNSVDKKWFKETAAHYESFDAFVKGWITKTSVQSFIHFVPQHQYIAQRNKLLIDKIYKFENMDQNLNDLSRRLSVHLENKHINKSELREEGYRQYYTVESKMIVAEIYKMDIEMFGYSF